MKFLRHFIIILVASFIAQQLFPWWSMAVIAFIASLVMGRSAFESFAAGFLAVGLLWLVMSLYVDWASGSTLSSKIAILFPVKTTFLLRLVTMLIGGVTAGLASLSGYSLKAIR